MVNPMLVLIIGEPRYGRVEHTTKKNEYPMLISWKFQDQDLPFQYKEAFGFGRLTRGFRFISHFSRVEQKPQNLSGYGRY